MFIFPIMLTMNPEKPSIDADYLLEKFPGKGGWTFARIPEIAQNKHTPFGWVTVSGSVDGYALRHIKLMPMGDGTLFLPIKAQIRKAIRKQAGNWVRVVLSPDLLPTEIPDELMACFELEDPAVLRRFQALPAFERNIHLDRIYTAKSEAEKVERIAELMRQMAG